MKRGFAKTVLALFMVGLGLTALTFSSCEEGAVEPGELKYCPTKIVNYHTKSDGSVKQPEITYGMVKSNSEGKCPDPTIEWKNP